MDKKLQFYVFFSKKNEKNKPEFKKKEGRNPHIISATNQHSAKKCLKFRGTSPAQRKKVPSIFEFQTAKPLPFSKSPKWTRNYSSKFFFQKKNEKNKPEFKKKEGRNPLYCHQPAFGKKMLEIQRNQPSPAKKSF
jgi:hypothetical protein